MLDIEIPKNRNKKKLLILAIIGFLVIALGFYLGNSYVKQNKVDSLVIAAEKLIEIDKFDEANGKAQEALGLKSRDISKVVELRERIANLKSSTAYMNEAEIKISKLDFLGAVNSLKLVTTQERNLKSVAEQKIESLKPKIEAQLELDLLAANKSKDYNEAVSLIDSYNRAFITSTKYSELRRKYINLALEQTKTASRIALARMSKRYDAFQDLTWYNSPNSPRYRNSNAFYIYFGTSDGAKLNLRLVIQYYSSDWLFIESAKVNVDGKIYEIDAANWETDNDTDIWEWSDESLSDRFLIEAIINSKSAVIRFDGSKYYDTRTITSSQKTSLKEVLAAYDSLR